jgi:uncharacterized protein
MLNLSTLRTPGVYIDEVPKFPPSIAAVETAIPAFIGYTKTDVFKGVSYKQKPLMIESMVEFVEKFGDAPPLTGVAVDLDVDNSVKTAQMNTGLLLYDSLRMYFRNGGGKCFIISLGKYPDITAGGFQATLKSDIEAALEVLKTEDEPTLILFPDGILLNETDLGSLYSTALVQCEAFKDRFLIADVKMSDPLKHNTSDIGKFKTAIGMSNLQFGAAYYPFIRVNLPRFIKFRDIRNKVTKLTLPLNWETEYIAASDTSTINLFREINIIIDKNVYLESLDAGALADSYAIRKKAFDIAVSTVNVTDSRDEFKKALGFLFKDVLKPFIDKLADGITFPLPAAPNNQNALDELFAVLDALKPSIEVLIKIARVLNTDTKVGPVVTLNNANIGGATWNYYNAAPTNLPADITGATALTASAVDVAIATSYSLTDQVAPATTETVPNLKKLFYGNATAKGLNDIFNVLINAISKIQNLLSTYEKIKESDVMKRIPTIGNVIGYLQSENYLLPPSGSVAGVYARVDAQRGVWKAPANESLINVVGPSVKITDEQHGSLNIDPSTGKSINVIRSFVGKGTLVWGARTLAGNDNEWRYVSVRRFFNMVEESCKKTTEQFVFEPNDANTWVKVQAMIENFLTTLWRQGALQGAITEHAFYVSVGLGKTMTALDILEGRMIVEIGMAVVRPAEFIVLRFSHKMPES